MARVGGEGETVAAVPIAIDFSGAVLVDARFPPLGSAGIESEAQQSAECRC